MEALAFDPLRIIIMMETESSFVEAWTSMGYGTPNPNDLKFTIKADILNHKAKLALRRIYGLKVVRGGDEMIAKYNAVELPPKEKHVFVQLFIREGDRTVTYSKMETIDDEKDVKEFGEDCARNHYDDVEEEISGEHYSDGGCVAVSLYRALEVSKEDFKVMSKYF